MVRLAIIRTVAIGLIVFGPLMLWFGWKYQKNQNRLGMSQAFNSVSTIAREVNVYQSDQPWVTQDGQEVQLQSFRGQPALATFVYTTCTHTCSLTTLRMKEVESWLPEDMKNRFRFLTFSMDPEVDTPERLKEYATRFEAIPPQWSFMTNSLDEVKSLAKLFSFYFKKEGDIFVHSDMIAVLDKEGNIQKQFWGSQLPEKIAETLQSLDQSGKL